MKAKKKPRGTKARVQAYKKRSAYIGTAIIVAILVAVIFVSSSLIYSLINPSPNHHINRDQTNNQPSQSKAAIVDQASLSPAGGLNETFIEKATNILRQGGYIVDYYPGAQVTVEFYKELPTHGYGLIIFRVHSTATERRDGEWIETPVCFFTSEPYTPKKYRYEQLTDQTVMVSYTGQPPYYFGIMPKFVASSMKGSFQNTIIVMTGCEGLDTPKMAEKFTQKGAKAYIGWDKPIFFSHTDAATIHILRHLIRDKQTIHQAVEQTMEEVGPDPADNSILRYYPLEAEDYTIES